MHILPYQAAHQTAVAELIVGIQRNEFGVAITLADQPDLQTIERFYQHGCGGFWVACEGERVVGTLGLLDIGEQALALRKMFVAPDFRGAPHRTAAALMDHALRHAHERAVRDIWLGTIDRFQAALRFYEKQGFAPVDAAMLPAAFPRMAVDNRFYHRTLW